MDLCGFFKFGFGRVEEKKKILKLTTLALDIGPIGCNMNKSMI